MEKNNNEVLEFKDPFQGVCFPYDPAYNINYDECETDIEKQCERIASMVAQKYNLIYRQGDSIRTHSGDTNDNIQKAHEEIGKYMNVRKIHYMGSPDFFYFFVFDSFSPKHSAL